MATCAPVTGSAIRAGGMCDVLDTAFGGKPTLAWMMPLRGSRRLTFRARRRGRPTPAIPYLCRMPSEKGGGTQGTH
jgi:hypothetical protein